jgi:hypothetical protein
MHDFKILNFSGTDFLESLSDHSLISSILKVRSTFGMCIVMKARSVTLEDCKMHEGIILNIETTVKKIKKKSLQRFVANI